MAFAIFAYSVSFSFQFKSSKVIRKVILKELLCHNLISERGFYGWSVTPE